MPVYTIEEIMAAKDRFREKPYPDFSLQNVCRKMAPSSLVRGENAFVARRATNAEDAVRKLVQSALNRLNDENFDEITKDLQSDMLLEAQAVKVFVGLCFEKALLEPAYCHIYARLCYDMARFEVQTTPQTQQAPASPTDSSPKAPQSRVRNAIIERAQAEFQTFDDFEAPENEPDDVVEEAYQRFVKRKKANIKFVGQLYLTRVLSSKVMLIVLSQLLNPGEGQYPSELNIELIIELLEIVGEKLEAQERDVVDEVFKRFAAFVAKKPSYPPRVHFKIMDCVDLRNNEWVSRDAARQANEPSPAAAGSKRATAARPSAAAGPSPAAVGTPTTGRKTMQFPSAPAAGGSSSSAATTPSPSGGSSSVASKEAGAWRNMLVGRAGAGGAAAAAGGAAAAGAGGAASDSVSKAQAMASATASIPSSVMKAVGKIVEDVRAKWSHPDTALATEWPARFAGTELARPDLTAAVIQHVVVKACTTTKSYAQAEAAGFFVFGLGFTADAVLPGLTRALIYAVLEGIVEDAPKFSQRLVRVLEDVHRAVTTGKPHEEGEELAPLSQAVRTNIAQNLSEVLLFALDGLKDCDFLDDITQEALLPVWSRLPMAEGDTLDEAALIKKLGETATQRAVVTPQAPAAAAEFLRFAKQQKWISGAATGKWMSTAPAASAPVVAALREKDFKA